MLPRLTSLLAVLVLTRLLSVPDFGLYALAMVTGDFCDMLMGVWFRNGFLRYYHGGRLSAASGGLDLGPILTWYALCTLSAAAFAWPIGYVLVRDDWPTFCCACSLYVVGTCTARFAMSVLRGEGKSSAYALLSFRGIATLPVAVGAAYIFGATFRVCAYALFGAQAIVGVASCIAIWLARRSGESTRSWTPGIVRYAWPLLVSSCLYAVANSADRALIQLYLGTQAIAVYAAAYSIARQPLDMICNSLNIVTFSEIVKAHDTARSDRAKALIGRQIAVAAGASIPAFVGLSLLASPIARLLLDHRYWSSVPALVPPIALGALAYNMRNVAIDQVYYLRERTKLQMLTFLPGVLILPISAMLLIPIMGVSGAAYSVALGNLAGLAISSLIADRVVPLRPKAADIRAMASATLAMFVVVSIISQFGGSAGWTVPAAVGAGALVYTGSALLLNFLDLRPLLLGVVTARLRRAKLN